MRIARRDPVYVVDFGDKFVTQASGATNLYGSGLKLVRRHDDPHAPNPGEGYPPDRLLKRIFPKRYSWEGTIPVAKTYTTFARPGNMPLDLKTLMPLEFKPKCIRVSPLNAETLNAVGLTNLGIEAHLNSGELQRYKESFFISWMGVGTLAEQVQQAREFVRIMRQYMNQFRASFVIEINRSCPNTGRKIEDGEKMVHESLAIIDVIATLERVPLSIKFNLLTSARDIAEVAKHPAVGNITLPNTTPWGAAGLGLNWNMIFPWYHAFGHIKDEQGRPRSPLHKIDPNGGGLSTPQVIGVTCQRIQEIRTFGYTKNIIGGGPYCMEHIHMLLEAGANGIAIGAVKLHRPLRLQKMIQHGNLLGRLMENARNADRTQADR